MHAIKFLKQEHGKAKSAFHEIERASGARRGQLWSKLQPELTLHEEMEEKHLYGPLAREGQARGSLAGWEQTHRKEVEEAETLMGQIARLEPADERWLAAVEKLRGALEEHIRQEEQQIWPEIEQIWDAGRLEEAGEQMEAMKPEPSKAAH